MILPVQKISMINLLQHNSSLLLLVSSIILPLLKLAICHNINVCMVSVVIVIIVTIVIIVIIVIIVVIVIIVIIGDFNFKQQQVAKHRNLLLLNFYP